MRGTLRRTTMKDWFEIIRETCPICGKSGGCMLHADGNRVVCIRVESKTVFSARFQSWLHYLKEPVKVNAKVEDYVPANPKAPVEQLNAVFEALLDSCPLHDNHYEQLTGESRAMTDSEIHHRKYRSFPNKPWNTIKMIRNFVDESAFSGIPGFYKNQYGWTIAGMSGILIPYRNERNQLLGFQIRVDNPGLKTVLQGTFKDKVTADIIERPNLVQVKINGTVFTEQKLSAGERIDIMVDGNYGNVSLKKGQKYFWLSSANKDGGTGAGNPLPVHVAVPSHRLEAWNVGEVHQTKSVWITEGALKADIAVEHLAKIYQSGQLKDIEESPTVLGLPGVATWLNLMPILESMKTETVTIAYDMDMLSNPDVQKATRELMVHLKKSGYKVRLAMWDDKDGKGIDDMFINSKFPQVKEM